MPDVGAYIGLHLDMRRKCSYHVIERNIFAWIFEPINMF